MVPMSIKRFKPVKLGLGLLRKLFKGTLNQQFFAGED